MLILASRITGMPIMGLQTGAELARIGAPVIDPRNLSILAYEINGPLLDVHPSFLRIADMREMSDIGMIVDSSDEFIGIDDVIKIKETYNYHFNPVGMHVIDEKNHRLGKVENMTIEPKGFIIQQLIVKKPLLQSLNETELLIHRSQIIEVNDTTIKVRAGVQPPEPIKNAVRSYANPFRRQSPQVEGASAHRVD